MNLFVHEFIFFIVCDINPLPHPTNTFSSLSVSDTCVSFMILCKVTTYIFVCHIYRHSHFERKRKQSQILKRFPPIFFLSFGFNKFHSQSYQKRKEDNKLRDEKKIISSKKSRILTFFNISLFSTISFIIPRKIRPPFI